MSESGLSDLVPLRGTRLINAGPYEDFLQDRLTEILICDDLIVH